MFHVFISFPPLLSFGWQVLASPPRVKVKSLFSNVLSGAAALGSPLRRLGTSDNIHKLTKLWVQQFVSAKSFSFLSKFTAKGGRQGRAVSCQRLLRQAFGRLPWWERYLSVSRTSTLNSRRP